MKRKITLLLLAAASVISVNAQVLINEGFTSTFNPGAAGWGLSNLSTPVGTSSWFQGSGANFPSFDGGPNDYFAANFNNAATAGGGISDWLVTPNVTIYNGAVFQ